MAALNRDRQRKLFWKVLRLWNRIEESETESEESESSAEPVEILLEDEETEADTNEQLLSSQEIVTPPVAEKTFRFMKIEKVPALSKKKDVSIFEKKDEQSIVVGNIGKKGLIYILSEEEDGWVYVESGKVRGFVKKKMLLTGKSAEKYIEKKGEKNLNLAEELIEPLDNEALDYKKITAYETIEKKKYAIALKDLNIFEEIPEEENELIGEDIESEDEKVKPSVVGVLEKDGVCYVLADSSEDWVYVESGDARGFVDASLLMRGREAKKFVKEQGEENLENSEREDISRKK